MHAETMLRTDRSERLLAGMDRSNVPPGATRPCRPILHNRQARALAARRDGPLWPRPSSPVP
ncbi:hypothetical protein [Jannaschia ovalis]|uniref:Uncharacterized protein n=1 Tax=Jannaschia ovalis TaxID=3038773 RepID=A0ABY8LCG6_9RHOB|nr:hypothetical protein [Jannaschia sp. GRR-S6-38]WGH79016.1 hypothetical protein P8627_01790 [Jannaschia sp. GRR-S6-38]